MSRSIAKPSRPMKKIQIELPDEFWIKLRATFDEALQANGPRQTEMLPKAEWDIHDRKTKQRMLSMNQVAKEFNVHRSPSTSGAICGNSPSSSWVAACSSPKPKSTASSRKTSRQKRTPGSFDTKKLKRKNPGTRMPLVSPSPKTQIVNRFNVRYRGADLVQPQNRQHQ